MDDRDDRLSRFYHDDTDTEIDTDTDRDPGEAIEAARPGAGAIVTRNKNKRDRRLVMSRLLCSQHTFDEICEIMAEKTTADGKPGFALSRAECLKLQREVFASWGEEDAERDPYRKAAQRRRIADEIRRAGDAGVWTAVANMEKVLANIDGTNAPLEINAPAGTRLTDALLAILGEEDPEVVRELVENEQALIAHSARPVGQLIDITPGPKKNIPEKVPKLKPKPSEPPEAP